MHLCQMKGGRAQAFGCWTWSNFLQTVGDQGKPLALLNMDETSLKLSPETKEGWVVADRPDRESLVWQTNGASLGERRAAVSLVAFLCDKVEIQRVLPQIFLCNEHVLSQREVDELNASTNDNVFFVRRKSGWVNKNIMIKMLEVLSASLSTCAEPHRFVFCMDTHSAHLNIEVVRACSRLGLLLFFVPASMTGLMQPLDARAFKPYKEWVYDELERRKAAGRSATLPAVEIMRVCAAGIEAILEKESWQKAFEQTGLKGQSRVSRQFLQRLGLDLPPAIPPCIPSAADLMAVYPRGRRIPVDDLFSLVLLQSELLPRPICLQKRARLTSKGRPPPPLPPPAASPHDVHF